VLALVVWHGLLFGGRALPTQRGEVNASGIVVLFSDYGTSGADAAILRAEVRSAANVEIHDGSQDLPGLDVGAASYVLDQQLWSWPPGTTFVVAVDPGTSGERAMLAAELWPGGYRVVAPDNGVLTDALARAERVEIREITNQGLLSSRREMAARPGLGVLGPVAAHLAHGAPLALVGNPVSQVEGLGRVQPTVRGGKVSGSIVYADGWGNLRTNIPEALLAQAGLTKPATLHLTLPDGGGADVPWVEAYDDVLRDTLLVLKTMGTDRMEIAVSYGSAAKRLKLKPGDTISLQAAVRR
jgi:S-adenosylmethionine hydrolase